MAQVFDTEQRAAAYAAKMNKKARVYKYVIYTYPKSQGGNGKKVIVRKVKK
jgi:hypothetical protein